MRRFKRETRRLANFLTDGIRKSRLPRDTRFGICSLRWFNRHRTRHFYGGQTINRTILIGATSASLALFGCQTITDPNQSNISKLPTGTIAGFDENKFRDLRASSGSKFSSQARCIAHLDRKLIELLAASDGALYLGVDNVRSTLDGRSFNYAGHFNLCGAPPREGQSANICRVPAPDTFVCNDGRLQYQRAPTPPSAPPQR